VVGILLANRAWFDRRKLVAFVHYLDVFNRPWATIILHCRNPLPPLSFSWVVLMVLCIWLWKNLLKIKHFGWLVFAGKSIYLLIDNLLFIFLHTIVSFSDLFTPLLFLFSPQLGLKLDFLRHRQLLCTLENHKIIRLCMSIPNRSCRSYAFGRQRRLRNKVGVDWRPFIR